MRSPRGLTCSRASASALNWIDRWGPIHADRWAWADQQIEQFVSDLDPTLARHFRQPTNSHVGQIGAVLYGKTQVGKTTLILRLMGLQGDREGEVAQGLTSRPPNRILCHCRAHSILVVDS